MIRRRIRGLGHLVAVGPRALWGWQAGIPDEGRVVLAGLGLVAGGLLLTPYPALAAIVPGAILTLAGLGWRPVRSR